MEEGKHAAESGMDLKAYAERSGKVRKTLTTKVLAFRVMSVADVGHEAARDNWSQLAEIHAAPPWLWSGLVTAWSRQQETRRFSELVKILYKSAVFILIADIETETNLSGYI